MKRKKFTPEQIVKTLQQVEEATASGETVLEVTREIGIHEQTYYRWNRCGFDAEGRSQTVEGSREGECPAQEAFGRGQPCKRRAEGGD